MRAHGLIQQGWVLEIDQAKTRFGFCNSRRRVISLSEPLTLLNNKTQVLDTIMHEIAHALTPGCGHNRTWKQMAIALGASGERCASSDSVVPPKTFIGRCPECPAIIERHRRSRKPLYHSTCLRAGKRSAITWERKTI